MDKLMKTFYYALCVLALCISACTSDAVEVDDPWVIDTPTAEQPPPTETPPVTSPSAPDYHVPGSFEGAPIEGGGTPLEPALGTCYTLAVEPFIITGYKHGDRVNATRLHAGVDVRGGPGTPVSAAVGGFVQYAAAAGTWGGLVEVVTTTADQSTFITNYGHLDPRTLLVEYGDYVTPGQILGELATRDLNGGWMPHLHQSVYSGAAPSAGVLKGHVPVAEFQGYHDPIAFLDQVMRGINCGSQNPVAPPDDVCDVDCLDLANDACGMRIVCGGQVELDCGPCEHTPPNDPPTDPPADPEPVCEPHDCDDVAGCGDFSDGCGSMITCRTSTTRVCDQDRLVEEDECGQVQRVIEHCSNGCDQGRCLSCEDECFSKGKRDPIEGHEAVGGGQVIDVSVVDAKMCGAIELIIRKADGSELGAGNYKIRAGSCRHFGASRNAFTLHVPESSVRVTLAHRGSVGEDKIFCVTKDAGAQHTDPDYRAWWYSNFAIVGRKRTCN